MTEFTLSELTVGEIWDAKKEQVPDDELPFYLLSKLTRKDGQPLSLAEFRALPFPTIAGLMSQLNLGNEPPK